jgi:hypothetical protein
LPEKLFLWFVKENKYPPPSEDVTTKDGSMKEFGIVGLPGLALNCLLLTASNSCINHAKFEKPQQKFTEDTFRAVQLYTQKKAND